MCINPEDTLAYKPYRNLAAVECHMIMSLNSFSPVAMNISTDTASERYFLPEPKMLSNKLLLTDAGYPDSHFLASLNSMASSILSEERSL